MRTRVFLVSSIMVLALLTAPAGAATNVMGKKVCFPNGSSATFGPTNAYLYRWSDQRTVNRGKWERLGNNCVRVTFTHFPDFVRTDCYELPANGSWGKVSNSFGGSRARLCP